MEFFFNAESCAVRTFSNTHLVEMVMSPKVARYSIIVGVVELAVAGICVLVGIIALGMRTNTVIATSGLWALVVSSYLQSFDNSSCRFHRICKKNYKCKNIKFPNKSFHEIALSMAKYAVTFGQENIRYQTPVA